jgi:hypothetical protein
LSPGEQSLSPEEAEVLALREECAEYRLRMVVIATAWRQWWNDGTPDYWLARKVLLEIGAQLGRQPEVSSG